MTNTLETLKANMWKAVRDCEATEIGGGVFSPEELSSAYLQILVLEHEAFTRRTEVCELKLTQGALEDQIKLLEHDNKLMQAALKQYVDEPMSLRTKLCVTTAYRHVSGT